MRYEVTDGVAWLTINRPEARNALSKAVRDGLWDGVRRFNADEQGQGAGAHRRRGQGILRRRRPQGDGRRWRCGSRRLTSCRSSAATSRSPSRPSPRSTASRWRAGSCWRSMCDLCVAAAVGPVRDHRGQGRPRRPLGRPAAVADPAPRGDGAPAHRRPHRRPRRAERLGLVNRVVPDARLARARSGTSAAHRRQRAAVGAGGKEDRAADRRAPAPAAYDEAERIWAPVYLSEDAQEGPAAFRDKRPPAGRDA